MTFQNNQWVSETKVSKADPMKMARIKQEKAETRERENARILAYEQSQRKEKTD